MPTIDPPSDQPPQLATPRRAWRRWLAAPLALAAAVSSVVFVDETELVIVERLGEIVAVYDQTAPPSSDRGLHFKLPWPVSVVRRFDCRQLLLDPPAREMFTRDRKNITVSSFLAWKIADPAPATPLTSRPVVTFFRRLGDRATAESRLDARLRAALSAEIARSDLNQLLQVETSEQGPGDDSPLSDVARRTHLALVAAMGSETLRESLGIDLIDLRIRRINLPEGNRIAVYERMRTERMRIAERYRSAGGAERTRVESQARRQSEELLARAEADAERIRGEGEAEALTVLNQAHALDPEFYEFQRTLSAYSRILNDQTTLVLSAGSRMFRLLREGAPGMEPQPSSRAADALVIPETGRQSAAPGGAPP